MITKRIETHVEPEHSYELHYYCCPSCPKEFEDEEEAHQHYGETHAVKARTPYGTRSAHLLLTQEDYLAWLRSHRGIAYDGGVSEHGWDEPGWYVLRTASEPCGKGCCYRRTLSAESIQTLIGSALYAIEKEKKRIQGLERITALGLDYREDHPGEDDR